MYISLSSLSRSLSLSHSLSVSLSRAAIMCLPATSMAAMLSSRSCLCVAVWAMICVLVHAVALDAQVTHSHSS